MSLEAGTTMLGVGCRTCSGAHNDSVSVQIRMRLERRDMRTLGGGGAEVAQVDSRQQTEAQRLLFREQKARIFKMLMTHQASLYHAM